MKLSLAVLVGALCTTQLAAANPIDHPLRSDVLAKRATTDTEAVSTDQHRDDDQRHENCRNIAKEDNAFVSRVWDWSETGITARVLAKPLPEAKAIWHLGKGIHWYSSDEALVEARARQGWMYIGPIAWALKEPICGAVPLYKRQAGQAVWLTLDKAVHDAGMASGHTEEEILGYVFPPK
ncbi:hypothetical protein HGRIS_014857 [Hohenbuehelia grisea]|uniref:Uncharacterized protein n=1 Tax=Hohenbuehelia grisea TaxID=104357 RepID=A0ABR3IQY5_9AGAR